jgi:uncharacterized protein DUF6788
MALRTENEQRRVRRLLQRQRALVASLLELRRQLRGSVFRRYGTCGKAGCACREGGGHGPYFVLSTRSGGAGGFTYLDARRAAAVRRHVAGYRRFRGGLRRLRTLNQELLDALQRYQQAVASREGLRMGL